VGFERAIQVYDGAAGDFEPLPTAGPLNDQAPLQVDSQRMSFSLDGNHLVVATREARNGIVYTGVHALRPLSRLNRQMHDLRIPTVGFNFFHTSIPRHLPSEH
jgi:hypothetical protein